MAPHGRYLTKKDVEVLVSAYDDEPVHALLAALLIVGAPDALRVCVPTMTQLERDCLLKDLIEWRGLTPPTGSRIDT
ncbi:MAG: hypothetical protein FJW53_03875 [Actinobacteria bacterium]|nr:hypothetical protein [Actinomycetota bacterium]